MGSLLLITNSMNDGFFLHFVLLEWVSNCLPGHWDALCQVSLHECLPAIIGIGNGGDSWGESVGGCSGGMLQMWSFIVNATGWWIKGWVFSLGGRTHLPSGLTVCFLMTPDPVQCLARDYSYWKRRRLCWCGVVGGAGGVYRCDYAFSMLPGDEGLTLECCMVRKGPFLAMICI